jgi:hypothetical protein
MLPSKSASATAITGFSSITLTGSGQAAKTLYRGDGLLDYIVVKLSAPTASQVTGCFSELIGNTLVPPGSPIAVVSATGNKGSSKSITGFVSVESIVV